MHLLTPAEQTLCSQLRILPKPYLVIKETLVREYARRGGKLRRREARDLVKVDVNKTSRVWDFLVQAGFLQIGTEPQLVPPQDHRLVYHLQRCQLFLLIYSTVGQLSTCRLQRMQLRGYLLDHPYPLSQLQPRTALRQNCRQRRLCPLVLLRHGSPVNARYHNSHIALLSHITPHICIFCHPRITDLVIGFINHIILEGEPLEWCHWLP